MVFLSPRLSRPHRGRGARLADCSVRPCLEVLEDRVTPSGGPSLGSAPGAPVSGIHPMSPPGAIPVTVTAGNVTISFSNQPQTITLTATATANGAPLSSGTLFISVTDANGHSVGASPVLATVTNGSASVAFAVPAGLAPGTYTILAQLTDPNGNYTNGTDVPGTLTVKSTSSGGGGATAGTPPTMVQSWFALYMDGVVLALDQLFQQSAASVQADVNFQMQYAGSFGPWFELAGELAVFQVMQQHNA